MFEIFTWESFRPSWSANFFLSGFEMYFCTWNLLSRPFLWISENTARLNIPRRALPSKIFQLLQIILKIISSLTSESWRPRKCSGKREECCSRAWQGESCSWYGWLLIEQRMEVRRKDGVRQEWSGDWSWWSKITRSRWTGRIRYWTRWWRMSTGMTRVGWWRLTSSCWTHRTGWSSKTGNTGFLILITGITRQNCVDTELQQWFVSRDVRHCRTDCGGRWGGWWGCLDSVLMMIVFRSLLALPRQLKQFCCCWVTVQTWPEKRWRRRRRC